MNMLDIHIIYLGIIFLILYKSFSFIKKREIKENNPTIEYYEWKIIYYKMMVLYKFKKLYIKNNHIHNKKKWRNHMNSKSAFF